MTLADIITSNVIDLLKDIEITSASPQWTNTVKDVRITGLGSDFDYELEVAIQEKITEMAATNPELFKGDDTAPAKKKTAKKRHKRNPNS